MDRIATLQEKGKALLEERNFMDMTSRQEEEKVEGDETGSQHSGGEVDGLLSLNMGAAADCTGSVSHQHGQGDGHTGQGQLPIDLNMP